MAERPDELLRRLLMLIALQSGQETSLIVQRTEWTHSRTS